MKLFLGSKSYYCYNITAETAVGAGVVAVVVVVGGGGDGDGDGLTVWVVGLYQYCSSISSLYTCIVVFFEEYCF